MSYQSALTRVGCVPGGDLQAKDGLCAEMLHPQGEKQKLSRTTGTSDFLHDISVLNYSGVLA